jgi:uncharacterized protein YodC (DUF2158 family)
MAFKDGDEVQHKSGGPKMAIEGRSQMVAGVYVCSWWDDKKKDFQRKEFTENVLVAYQPPSIDVPYSV